MNMQILNSKSIGLCCPLDKEKRNKWLNQLDMEYKLISEQSKDIANFFKIFSHPSRIEILLMLKQRDHCVEEIVRKLKAPRSTVSHHIGILRKHNLINIKKHSFHTYYTLTEYGIEILKSLFSFRFFSK